MGLKGIGIKIRQLRDEKGWSQMKLADLSGVARGTIQELESGDGNPQIGTLDALANSLGLDSFMELLPPAALRSNGNVHQLRADPKAAQNLLEAHEVLIELAAAPQILRLSAIFLLTGDEGVKQHLLALPGGARRVQALGKLRSIS